MMGWVSIVHIVAVVFTIIELGLTAYLVSLYTGTSPSQFNFMVFNSVWTLLVLAYVGVVPLYYTRVFHRPTSLALETVTAIFWFAGSIALAADFGGPYSCHGSSWCGSTTAAITFGFFIWALFMALVVVDSLEALRSRRAGTRGHAKPYAGA